MLAQRLGRPLVQGGAVDPDLAGDGPPHSTSARTSEDLPEALGPMIPIPRPALRLKTTSRATSVFTPGAPR